MKSSLIAALEALGILAFALVLGLSYNSVRDDGLSLERNFFPEFEHRRAPPSDGDENGVDPNGTSQDPPPADPSNGTANGATTTNDPKANGVVEKPTPEQLVLDAGFQVCDLQQTLEYLDGLADAVVFADARSHEKYDDGHIPSAYELNYYQAEKLVGDVLGPIEEAMFVVIYCDGGDCEDSILLANYLHMEHGVPLDLLYVYVGGYNEWVERGLPTAKGHDRGEIPDLSEHLERILDEAATKPEDAAAESTGNEENEDTSSGSDQAMEQDDAGTAAEDSDDEGSGEPLEHGFQTMELDDIIMYTEELADAVALLDARSRSKYVDGHLPGAYYLNHYQSEKLIDPIKEAIADKDFIIVYCDGGDCEDSILLCTDLVTTYELDFERIYIYEGGYEEWTEAGNPVVKGKKRE